MQDYMMDYSPRPHLILRVAFIAGMSSLLATLTSLCLDICHNRSKR
jgi:hypothetical protein